MKSLPEEEWVNCPNCNDEGGYPVQVRGMSRATKEMASDAGNPNLEGMQLDVDDWELEQCEFCWTNPTSVYYQKNKPWEKP